MKIINKDKLQFLSFSIFPEELTQFVTTRKSGFSAGAYTSLNLAIHSPDIIDPHIAENKNLLLKTLGITKNIPLFVPRQCHSALVELVNDTSGFDGISCDGYITNKRNILLGIKTADCVPVILFDKVSGSLGAVHAGWRGTASGILSQAIQKMQEVFRSRPKDILVGIGPSISAEHYEVGEEVAIHFKDYKPTVLNAKTNGKYMLDLWEANKQQALKSGIPEQNIELAGYCSFKNDELFFSARRDGVESGRFLSCIGLIGNHSLL